MAQKIEETCQTLYALFDEQSTIREVGGDEFKVWEGKLVETCLSLGIPYGSYRRNVEVLEIIGSVQVLASGTRGSPTVVALLQPPTAELLARLGSTDARLTKQVEGATMMAEAQRIIDQLGGLDAEKLATILVNHEERITALEALTGEGESGKKKSKSE